MRFTVSPEQLKFFHLNGYLELENLITKQEASQLLKELHTLKTQSPGYPATHCFRSLPLIATLARKKGWGILAAELLHKKPLRLIYDAFSTQTPILQETLDEQSCGLIFNLTHPQSIFFKETIPDDTLYKEKETCYFFIILTARRVAEELNPLIVT